MKLFTSSVLSLGLFFSCAWVACVGPELRRVKHPADLEVAPRIEEVLDLGALPLASEGSLSLEHSDGLFTPGEWAVLLGPGLARTDARVDIAGLDVPVMDYVNRGLLVRVPRGLSTREAQRVRVTTSLGRAEHELPYASHVVVSDVSGNRLRFLRMSRKAERLFEKPYDLALPRVRKHVFSADGGLVYAVQAHADEDDGKYSLATVHVGAAKRAAQIGTLHLALSGVPLDLVAVPGRFQLWLLTQRELVVLDVQDPLAPREITRVALPEGTPWSLAALAYGVRAAVLEREHNVLWLFDMTAPVPSIVQSLALPPAGVPRASIAILSDRHDPQRLWVLQGRSLARLSQRADSKIREARSTIDRARAAVGLGPTEVAPEPASPDGERDVSAAKARVLGLTLTRELTVDRELPLPDAFLPLFLRSGSDGRLLVSGITSDATRLEDFGDTRADLKRLTSWLSGTTQFGRVIAVDPTGSRAPETLVQGMAMFFDVDQLADGKLVYSAMRLGVHLLPPGIGIAWKIESPHLDAVGIRTLSWTFLLPPYVSPPVVVQ